MDCKVTAEDSGSEERRWMQNGGRAFAGLSEKLVLLEKIVSKHLL
jgi:hypothetical protein